MNPKTITLSNAPLHSKESQIFLMVFFSFFFVMVLIKEGITLCIGNVSFACVVILLSLDMILNFRLSSSWFVASKEETIEKFFLYKIEVKNQLNGKLE